jgi:hypothetical protein
MTRCIRLSITAVAGLAAAALIVALPAAHEAAPRNANETHLVLTGVAVTTAERSETIENNEERSRGSVTFMAAEPAVAQPAASYDRHLYPNYLGAPASRGLL